MNKRIVFAVVAFWAVVISNYLHEVQSCETSAPPPGYTITPAPPQIFLGVILVEFSDIKHDTIANNGIGFTKTDFRNLVFSEN